MRPTRALLKFSGSDANELPNIFTNAANTDVKTPRYQIDNAASELDDPDFLSEWRMLTTFSESPEKIYQSVQYFSYLREAASGDDIHVFAITDMNSGACVGVVPVRITHQALSFRVRSKIIAAPSVRTIILLGSVAMLPKSKEVIEQLMAYLLNTFKDCAAVSMQAAPRDCQQQQLLWESGALQKKGHLYVMHGWRHCHTIPLPATFDQYQKQMSAKRRYNLNRQIKQLEKQAGLVQLHRITGPEQIPLLMKAISDIVPPGEQISFLSEEKYWSLVAHGLLHCYVLTAGDRAVGLIRATRYDKALHLHAIHHVPDLATHSIGTSILYLAIKDLTENFDLERIDLGYGVPAHRHESTNITVIRGHVLLMRKTLKNLVLARLHEGFTLGVNFVKHQLSEFGKRRASAKQS